MRTEAKPTFGAPYPLSQVAGGVSRPQIRGEAAVPALFGTSSRVPPQASPSGYSAGHAVVPATAIRNPVPTPLPASAYPARATVADVARAPIEPPAAAFARYFRDIRTRLGLPIDELARRLAVDPRILAALEAGAVAALPPWAEVERVVSHYLTVLSLDPYPALKVIAAALADHKPAGQPRAPVFAPPPAVSTDGVAVADTRGSRDDDHDHYDAGLTHVHSDEAPAVANRLPRTLLAAFSGLDAFAVSSRAALRTAGIVVVMLVVAGGTVLAAQSAIRRINHLPAPAAGFMRSASDSILMLFAPKRDGLRWIEVEDPRKRRGDKLQIARR